MYNTNYIKKYSHPNFLEESRKYLEQYEPNLYNLYKDKLDLLIPKLQLIMGIVYRSKNNIHKIYSALPLFEDIFQQLPFAKEKEIVDKTFLMLYTIEWAVTLHIVYSVPVSNITLVCDSGEREDCAKYFGFNTCTVQEFFDEKWKNKMKFDVIIGNPPYTDTVGSARLVSKNTNNSNIHFDFIRKSLDRSGIVALVVPGSWMTDKIKDEIVDNGLKSVKKVNASYFPDVGIRSSITFFITVFRYEDKIKIQDQENIWFFNRGSELTFSESIGHEICEKLKRIKNFTSGKNGNYEVNKGSKGSLERLISLNGHYSLEQSSSHKIKVLIYTGGKRDPARYVYSDIDKTSTSYGIVIPCVSDKHILGTPRILYPHEGVSDRNKVYYFSSLIEANNVLLFLSSKIIKFAMFIKKHNDTVNTNLNSYRWIPFLDFSRSWTDDELYKEFNLKESEIKYIEKIIR